MKLLTKFYIVKLKALKISAQIHTVVRTMQEAVKIRHAAKWTAVMSQVTRPVNRRNAQLIYQIWCCSGIYRSVTLVSSSLVSHVHY